MGRRAGTMRQRTSCPRAFPPARRSQPSSQPRDDEPPCPLYVPSTPRVSPFLSPSLPPLCWELISCLIQISCDRSHPPLHPLPHTALAPLLLLSRSIPSPPSLRHLCSLIVSTWRRNAPGSLCTRRASERIRQYDTAEEGMHNVIHIS